MNTPKTDALFKGEPNWVSKENFIRIALLKAAAHRGVEGEGKDWSYLTVANALSERYATNMNKSECLRHALLAWMHAIRESKFQFQGNLEELVLSPWTFPSSRIAHGVPLIGVNPDSVTTYGEYVDSVCWHLLTKLTIVRIGWCKEAYMEIAELLPKQEAV